jgi:hypothetical protein
MSNHPRLALAQQFNPRALVILLGFGLRRIGRDAGTNEGPSPNDLRSREWGTKNVSHVQTTPIAS